MLKEWKVGYKTKQGKIVHTKTVAKDVETAVMRIYIEKGKDVTITSVIVLGHSNPMRV